MGAPFECVKARRLLATSLVATGAPAAAASELVRAAQALAIEKAFRQEDRLLAELDGVLLPD